MTKIERTESNHHRIGEDWDYDEFIKWREEMKRKSEEILRDARKVKKEAEELSRKLSKVKG